MAIHLLPRVLIYLEAVAEHGSIQAASRAIGISASAIDRQIKLLEDRLGALLFDRMPTGMMLSPAGEVFVTLARRWRSDETRILSDVKQMQGIDLGHLRLVTMDSLVNGIVPMFLSHVAASFPKVRIDVDVSTPDEAVGYLEDGRADIALAFNLSGQRDMHVLWSADLPLYCIVAPGHPLASEARVTLNQVRDHAIVVQSRALSIRRILEARHSWMFAEGVPPIVTNSLQLLKKLVISGQYVALTSELDAAPELLSGQVVAIPVTGSDVVHQTIGIALNPRRTLPRIATIIAASLKEQVEDLLRAIKVKAEGRRPHD
ncbi:LysR family transcriptional regulator [Pseudoruegeria sp. SK021]|uniref:LysR family transcriptional regulator n=1 Tax=Pseudoruegeria sp. SK021 TaxID=1933035 RepID=UPI000A21C8CF|nr:LysR family transcriptional regulator [Pseudoruegeria sp. SK021]OSP54566.1 hypothetical protein BV911_11930 [Pseudoruegeria sp. SK021]